MKNSRHRRSSHTAGKVLATFAAISLPLISWAAHPGSARGAYFAKAKVIDTQPIVELVQVTRPQQVCWVAPARRSHRQHQVNSRSHSVANRSFVPIVVGGIIGGVAGNQFGSGRGKDAMTVAGALLGASIGRDASLRHPRRAGYRSTRRNSVRRHCEITDTVHEEERLTGYRVTYRYQGRTYVTEMPDNPGRFVRVRVSVAPVG